MTETSETKSQVWTRLALLAAAAVWLFVFREWIGHESQNNQVFERFSPAFVAALAALGLLVIPLAAAFVRPARFQRWLDTGMAFLQARAWLALPALAVLFYFAYAISRPIRLENFPDTQLVLTAGLILGILFVIFYRWGAVSPPPIWRRSALYLVLALVAFELLVQTLSFGRLLPEGVRTQSGLFKPYGRLYDGENGNRITNRFGWYSSPVPLADDSYKILLIGDEYLFAGDMPIHLRLESRLADLLNAESTDRPVEVISVAAPGYGPAHYFEGVKNSVAIYQPDEIIVFVNLGNDFLNLLPSLDPRSPRETLFYVLDETGGWNIHPGSISPQHVLFHQFTDAARPLSNSLLATTRSHILADDVISDLLDGTPSQPLASGANEPVEGAFLGVAGFIFDRETSEGARTALTLSIELLKISRQVALANGIEFRVVTIPFFPTAFLDQAPEKDWIPVLGTYDFLLPERQMQQAADGAEIEVLPMGRYLYENQTAPTEIQELYIRPENGGWTSAGHDFFAQAVFQSFFKP